MSYEGSVQHICEKGHYTSSDCYTEAETCCVCEAKLVFRNAVDETNGDAYGYIPLKLLEVEAPERTVETSYREDGRQVDVITVVHGVYKAPEDPESVRTYVDELGDTRFIKGNKVYQE